ncbi:hypothetical protein [Streptomyces sp. NPDC002962]|uniref:hypothetical protein n=1 Tax=Streptomyces sp. NPDC002962 TaxID=3364674 RepID=UPI003695E46D
MTRSAPGTSPACSNGADPAGRLARANTLGAFTVAADGDWEGLPRRDELHLLAAALGTTIR